MVVFSTSDVSGGEVNMLSGIGLDDSLLIDEHLNGVVVAELDGTDEPDVFFSSVSSVLDLVSGSSTSSVVVDVIDLVEVDESVISAESGK